VVVRNRWTGTEAASGTKYEFSGIVIWRIAHRRLVGTIGVSDSAKNGLTKPRCSEERLFAGVTGSCLPGFGARARIGSASSLDLCLLH